MRIKALIFDVDGTLADTEEAHRRAFNRAFERHELVWHWSADEYARLLETAGGKERIAAYLESLPLEAAARRALHARIPVIHATKTEIYGQMVRERHVPFREGVERLIGEAARAGVSVAIASTTTRANIEALLSANLGRGERKRFRVIGAADDARHLKPSPEIYEHVLERLQERAEDCVAIEDSINGLVAAKAAGLFTVITPSHWTRLADFAAADLVLPSLGACAHPLSDIDKRFAVTREAGRRPHPMALEER